MSRLTEKIAKTTLRFTIRFADAPFSLFMACLLLALEDTQTWAPCYTCIWGMEFPFVFFHS